MIGEELIAHTRNDVLHDSATPYLWSDDLILLYLNEGQDAFARRTHALLDNESALTQIDLEAGVSTYPLSAKVIHVYGAALSGAVNDLKDYTRRFIPSNLLTATGDPVMFSMDEAKHTIRVFPVPKVAGLLQLRVARLPLSPITEATAPEIPEQYHIDLPEFVAMRCLRNAETDGSNLGSAEVFEKSWKARVGEAKREYYRFRMGPNVTAQNNWTGKRK